MAADPDSERGPSGPKGLFREFWFQVSVAVTATVIATVAVAVVPHFSGSGDNSGKASSAVTVITKNAADDHAATTSTTIAGPAASPPTTPASTAPAAPGATTTIKAAQASAAGIPTTVAASAPPPTTAPPTTAVPSAKVPDVHGATLNNASVSLKSVGFNDIPFVNGCFGGPPGTVTSQSPAAGVTVATTTPVRLQVEAVNCAVVPDVTGQQLQQASNAVNGAGFHNIPFRYECLGSSNIGAVIVQSPVGGTDTATDTPVTLRLQANNCTSG